MQITDYTLSKFTKQDAELINEYVVALRYIKPISTERQIISLTLREVEEIKKQINSGNDKDLIKIIATVQGVKEKEVYKLKIIKFFGLVSSIREQLETIFRAEENALKPNHIDMKWQAVNGSERMSKFGIYNTLESISGGDASKYEYFMNMSYSEVFTILLMRKTQSDLQYEMSQIKTKSE